MKMIRIKKAEYNPRSKLHGFVKNKNGIISYYYKICKKIQGELEVDGVDVQKLLGLAAEGERHPHVHDREELRVAIVGGETDLNLLRNHKQSLLSDKGLAITSSGRLLVYVHWSSDPPTGSPSSS